MAIEDVYSIQGRGTVVTGRVEQGRVKVGDAVEICGLKPTLSTVVTGVEMFHKSMNEGQAGDNVGLLLRGVKREEVLRGQLVAKPKSVKVHHKFEANVYALTKDEGGRHTPFTTNYSPQFFVRTADVSGKITLPKEKEMVMPGDNSAMTVELQKPVGLHEGLRFALRDGGKTIGAGVVSKILDCSVCCRKQATVNESLRHEHAVRLLLLQLLHHHQDRVEKTVGRRRTAGNVVIHGEQTIHARSEADARHAYPRTTL